MSDQNETPDTADQDALTSEVVHEDTGFDVEFDGHTYRVRDGQPSPKALGYAADFYDNQNSLHAVLFIKEMIGKSGWDLWCERHESSQIIDMLVALNEAFSGNS